MKIIRDIHSYTEASPSGTGIRILALGALPPGRRRKGPIEMYGEGSPRYLTITGQHVAGTPRQIQDRYPELDQFHTEHLGQDEVVAPCEDLPVAAADVDAKRVLDVAGEKLATLWQGRWEEAGYGSRSEADLAFASMLAYYVGPDTERVWALVRQSGMMRDKWDREDYRTATLNKAINQEKFYDWTLADLDASLESAIQPVDVDALDREDTKGKVVSLKRPFLTLDDLENLPEMRWLIADLIPADGLLCVYGPSGAGKSFVALDMALSVASGVPYLNRHEVKAGPVLYIMSEGLHGLPGRVREWRRAHPDALPDILFSGSRYDLQQEEEAEEIISNCRHYFHRPPVLIVIDTLIRNFGGGDTDKNQDMSRFVSCCDMLKDGLGAAVMVLHHTGWADEDRERGAKALRDCLDTSIGVNATKDGIRVRCAKQKGGENFPDIMLVKVRGTDSLILRTQDDVIHSQGVKNDDDMILALIPTLDQSEADRGITSKRLQDLSGKPKATVDRVIKRLREEGLVKPHREFGASAATPTLYFREPQ